MLLNDLYFLESVSDSEGTLAFHISIKADHPIYKGHFPGQPVTPGVVLSEMVKELLENYLGKPLEMVNMRQCKFLAPHSPLRYPRLVITIKQNGGDGYPVQAAGSSGEEVFFKLSAGYRAA